jgi:hypothetical protein
MTGYFIEDGKIVSVKGEDKCLERSRDDEIDNGGQIFWTRDGAESELAKRTDPVAWWHGEYTAGRVSLYDFQQLVGPPVADAYLAKVADE